MGSLKGIGTTFGGMESFNYIPLHPSLQSSFCYWMQTMGGSNDCCCSSPPLSSLLLPFSPPSRLFPSSSLLLCLFWIPLFVQEDKLRKRKFNSHASRSTKRKKKNT